MRVYCNGKRYEVEPGTYTARQLKQAFGIPSVDILAREESVPNVGPWLVEHKDDDVIEVLELDEFFNIPPPGASN